LATWIARLRRCAILPCVFATGALAEPATLRLGVLPYLETLQLIRLYQPLATHLQEQLQHPVLIKTRASFSSFTNAVAAGDFNLTITAPHLARMAQQHGLQPIAGFAAELRVVAILPAGATLPQLQQRPQLFVAVPDQMSIMALATEHWLAAEFPEKAVNLLALQSHSNAIDAVIRGNSDLAFVDATVPSQLPAEQRAAIQVLDAGIAMPHMIVLCRPASEGWCEQAAGALQAFPETTAGQAFFRASQLGGLAPAPDLSRFDPLLRQLESRPPERYL
jgi:phosphonate transport system substrate-binding protein